MVRPNDILFDDGWDGSGIYKSNDHGKTLKKILSTWTSTLLISPSNPNVMYGMDGSRILKSIDGGDSWKMISMLQNVAIKKIVLNPVDHNVLYAITIADTNSGIEILLLKSVDGGETWQDISSNSPFDNSNAVAFIVVDPINPDIFMPEQPKEEYLKVPMPGKPGKQVIMELKHPEISKNRIRNSMQERMFI